MSNDISYKFKKEEVKKNESYYLKKGFDKGKEPFITPYEYGSIKNRNKQKIIILAIAVLLLLTGCKDNNQEYCDMPNSLMAPMLKEWVSPDGVHYWMYSDDYCSGLTPRYDNKGNLVIESNYSGY